MKYEQSSEFSDPSCVFTHSTEKNVTFQTAALIPKQIKLLVMLQFLSCALKLYRKNLRICGSQQSIRDHNLLHLILANTFGSSVYSCLSKMNMMEND